MASQPSDRPLSGWDAFAQEALLQMASAATDDLTTNEDLFGYTSPFCSESPLSNDGQQQQQRQAGGKKGRKTREVTSIYIGEMTPSDFLVSSGDLSLVLGKVGTPMGLRFCEQPLSCFLEPAEGEGSPEGPFSTSPTSPTSPSSPLCLSPRPWSEARLQKASAKAPPECLSRWHHPLPYPPRPHKPLILIAANRALLLAPDRGHPCHDPCELELQKF